jgi:hypothetical protein
MIKSVRQTTGFLGGAVATVVVLSGCGGGSSGGGQAAASSHASTHTITLDFTLNDMNNVHCPAGHGGYADITVSAPVTVYDGSGKVIATTPLGTNCKQGQLDGQDDNLFVVWTPPIPNVPDVPFYQVEISHRGKLTMSKSELESKSWTVTASLGS